MMADVSQSAQRFQPHTRLNRIAWQQHDTQQDTQNEIESDSHTQREPHVAAVNSMSHHLLSNSWIFYINRQPIWACRSPSAYLYRELSNLNSKFILQISYFCQIDEMSRASVTRGAESTKYRNIPWTILTYIFCSLFISLCVYLFINFFFFRGKLFSCLKDHEYLKSNTELPTRD